MATVETIKLEKHLQIMLVESLHEELEEIVSSGAELSLDGSQVEKCDTACLQLLAAVQTSLNGRENEIRWVGASAILLESAQQLGLLEALNLQGIDASAGEE